MVVWPRGGNVVAPPPPRMEKWAAKQTQTHLKTIPDCSLLKKLLFKHGNLAQSYHQAYTGNTRIHFLRKNPFKDFRRSPFCWKWESCICCRRCEEEKRGESTRDRRRCTHHQKRRRIVFLSGWNGMRDQTDKKDSETGVPSMLFKVMSFLGKFACLFLRTLLKASLNKGIIFYFNKSWL